MKSATVVLGLLLLLIAASCGGGPESSSNQVPPPAAAPASSASSGYQVAAVTDGGSLAGKITVSGPVPKLPPRQITKDPKTCGTGTRNSEQLIVSGAGGLKNAVVLIEGIKSGKAVHAESQKAQIDQKNCEYSPHIQVMLVNTDIAVVNSDPVLHNIHLYNGG